MNEVAKLREKILVMSELSNIRAELVRIAARVERIPETLLQIELMRRDVQVVLVASQDEPSEQTTWIRRTA
jgi:hypothetical protein